MKVLLLHYKILMLDPRQGQVRILRLVRKVHKIMGISLIFFILVLSFTGILLGWKKNSGGIILAETVKGISDNPSHWLSIDSLLKVAQTYAIGNLKLSDPEPDRIDVRPSKGIIKVSFKNTYDGLQIDCTNGNLLLVEKRYSDLIEHFHDGSIVDTTLNIKSGSFKLFYTTLMSLSLMTFCITGFWLYYGPKRLKRY